MKIYFENLQDTIDNAKLSEVFSSYGGVHSTEVVKDIFTRASKGPGYVVIDDEFSKSAIIAQDQTILSDFKINVEDASALTERKECYKASDGPLKVSRSKKN